MQNHPIRAAAEGLPKLTRRAALAGASAGLLAGTAALAVSCSPTEAPAGTMFAEAIDRHRRTAAAREAAESAFMQKFAAFSEDQKAHPITYQTSAGTLTLFEEKKSLSVYDTIEPTAIIEARARRMHEIGRECSIYAPDGKISQEQADANRAKYVRLRDASTTTYFDDLAARDRAVSIYKARLEECGVQAADDHASACWEVENEAWSRLLEAPCFSHSEVVQKIDYIVGSSRWANLREHAEEASINGDGLETLLFSLAGGGA